MVTVAAMFFEEITVFCRSKQVKGLQDVCGCFSQTTAVPPANDLHTPPKASWEAEHPNLFSKQQFFGFHLGLGFMSFLLVSPTSSVVKSMAGSLEDMPLADADQPQVMERPKGVARKE